MGNIVVVQKIHTEWSKASRGGANAVKRNAVPEVAKVPVPRIKESELILVHHIHAYRERNGFSQPFEEIRVNPTVRPLAIGCVKIDHNDKEVIAKFHYESGCGGAPDRGWARKTLHLTVDEWGQFVYNGRFTPWYDGDWWYEKMVVNVGLFERLTPGVFTRQAPTCRFEAMAGLF